MRDEWFLIKRTLDLPLPCPTFGDSIIWYIEFSIETYWNPNQMISLYIDGRGRLGQVKPYKPFPILGL